MGLETFSYLLFGYCCLFFWYHIKKSLPNSISWSFLPIFLLRGLAFMQVFYSFWLNFCRWCNVQIQLHCFAYGHSIFPVPLVEKIALSPLNGLDNFAENHLTIYRGFVGALYFIPRVSMYVIIPEQYCFDSAAL